jgi:hypothetical protein
MQGPQYSYADELKTPREIGVNRDGSPEAIGRAMAGVNFFVDAIGFGHSTGLARNRGMQQSPLGLRYFIATGATCSNGASMYEYVNTIPSGLPGRVSNEVQQTLGVPLQGMAPGIIEDATRALNPEPLFRAVTGSGYPACKKVTLPVGDAEGRVASRVDGTQWINESVEMRDGRPHQTRWVYDRDLSAEEYNATPKTEAPPTEGFAGEPSASGIAAGVLCAAVILGLMIWKN